jgi:hypothetical protein
VGADDFTIIKFWISLTLRPVLMISVILPELGLHLHISSLAKFVIFYDITSFHRRDFLQVLSINLQFLGFGQTTIYGILHNTTIGQIQAYPIFLTGQQ